MSLGYLYPNVSSALKLVDNHFNFRVGILTLRVCVVWRTFYARKNLVVITILAAITVSPGLAIFPDFM
jgi:hypothetical protein